MAGLPLIVFDSNFEGCRSQCGKEDLLMTLGSGTCELDLIAKGGSDNIERDNVSFGEGVAASTLVKRNGF
jgi:hypothetical protein